MGHASMPGCILSIKQLHTPGLVPSAEPAVLGGALPGDVWICDTQLPVSLPGHVNLPVMTTEAESLRAHDIEGGVKALREIRKLLPGVCVSGTVTLGGDDQLWVGRLWVQMHLAGIWRHIFNNLSTGSYKKRREVVV